MKSKILIAEDERIIAEDISDNLISLGYGVCGIANSGEKVIDKAKKHKPDLILMDINLKGDMDGIQAAQKIKSLLNVPIIFVTAYSTEKILERAKITEPFGYLIKPIEHRTLSATIEMAMYKFGMDAEREALKHKLADAEKRALQSDLNSARAQSLESQKLAAIGLMAGNIAHEIGNPMAIIDGRNDALNEMCQSGSIDLKKVKKITERINSMTERVFKIMESLKNVSRNADASGIESVPLVEIIEESVTLCRHKFENNEIKLDLTPIPTHLTLDCNRVEISQVFVNLINNAEHAVRDLSVKWVRIEIVDQEDIIEVMLTDSGKGIPKSMRDSIFDTFFTTKSFGVGTGLGLSTCKRIIEKHHGTIKVDPRCRNTRFVITLPKVAS